MNLDITTWNPFVIATTFLCLGMLWMGICCVWAYRKQARKHEHDLIRYYDSIETELRALGGTVQVVLLPNRVMVGSADWKRMAVGHHFVQAVSLAHIRKKRLDE